jgi:hypothetical protein
MGKRYVALRSDTGESWYSCDPLHLQQWVPVEQAAVFRLAKLEERVKVLEDSQGLQPAVRPSR